MVTVGDFVPRSMSEIIEDEMPLRAASTRKLKPAASRRCLTARPVRRAKALTRRADKAFSAVSLHPSRESS